MPGLVSVSELYQKVTPDMKTKHAEATSALLRKDVSVPVAMLELGMTMAVSLLILEHDLNVYLMTG